MPSRRWILGTALACLCGPGTSSAEPALWSVEGDAATVYIFGSVHLLTEGRFAIEGALAEALAGAERVCLELDPDATDPARTLSATLARAVDPEGRSLFDLLGSDAGRVRALARDAGVDIDALATFEPWFAGLTVSLLALQSHGYDPKHGVEQIVHAAARREGKAVCGLETLDEQLALLDAMPAESQRNLLLQSIEESEEVVALIEPLVDAWRAGDQGYLEARLAEDIADYPDLADPLIFDRNARWTEEIAGMLDGDADVLVVVGAMHLAGERGVPAMLEDRGYRVRRH